MGCPLSKKKQKPRTIHVSPKKQGSANVAAKPPCNACNFPLGTDHAPAAIVNIAPTANGNRIQVALGSAEAQGSRTDSNLVFAWSGGANSSLSLDGNKYKPTQFHFHTPSEHTLDGTQFPLELHVVHAAGDGKFVVLCFVFQYGDAEDPFLAQMWTSVPQLASPRPSLPVGQVDGSSLVTSKQAFYRYSGPPPESVEWLVVQQPRIVTPGQVAILFGALRTTNARVARQPTSRPVTLLS
ncbi:carbonic anhydrase [Achlya hypogyna]|uniref:Carbonic anhydrase n=1 Tax=Achlya hypogyna TaxID=1202772 RepID=A0A1V9YYD3_ACHHY|nr:carbonic anhydrase [Achlya hypogyna]